MLEINDNKEEEEDAPDEGPLSTSTPKDNHIINNLIFDPNFNYDSLSQTSQTNINNLTNIFEDKLDLIYDNFKTNKTGNIKTKNLNEKQKFERPFEDQHRELNNINELAYSSKSDDSSQSLLEVCSSDIDLDHCMRNSYASLDFDDSDDSEMYSTQRKKFIQPVDDKRRHSLRRASVAAHKRRKHSIQNSPKKEVSSRPASLILESLLPEGEEAVSNISTSHASLQSKPLSPSYFNNGNDDIQFITSPQSAKTISTPVETQIENNNLKPSDSSKNAATKKALYVNRLDNQLNFDQISPHKRKKILAEDTRDDVIYEAGYISDSDSSTCTILGK